MTDSRSDDERGFTEFVIARRPALVRLGWALTGSEASGEDVAQTALNRLWRHWSRISRAGEPWQYAQRVVVTQVATWRGHRYRSAERLSSNVDDEMEVRGADGAVDVDSRIIVDRWLRRLPPRQRSVVALRIMCDLSVEETAEILGCSSGTVKSQTSKALNRLRKIVATDIDLGFANDRLHEKGMA